MEKSDLKPLEVNGITAVTLGTLIWTFSLIGIMALNLVGEISKFNSWIPTILWGILLGIFGYIYTHRKANKLTNKISE
jgi:hypothetical protein